MVSLYLSNLWRWAAGVPELDTRVGYAPDLDTIRIENDCPEFHRLASNRLVVGFFRYGPLTNKAGGKKYDNLGSIAARLALYRKTGNDELLVDIRNYAMLEFKNGTHPKKHFKPVDDGIHAGDRK